MSLPAIPTEETLAPVQATKDILIAKADNKMDSKMKNLMKALEALTF